MWIDTHAHLDAPEFTALDATAQRAAARALGVQRCVIPAVARSNWEVVRTLAHQYGDAYALGIHPLCVPDAKEDDLQALDEALHHHRSDPRLVAVGEIGLDFFVPALVEPAMRERQTRFYREQLRLARRHGLPVLLHVRRSADAVLKGLRELPPQGGIAHAFNGSHEQAMAMIGRGMHLGFGGASTFDSARQLRRLAAELPLSALVLETDAPDIPPQWLYATAQQRAQGQAQGINHPRELPRIGAVIAQLRGLAPEALAEASTHNALRALPRLAALAEPA